jgi:hypothetical protein
MSFARSLLLTRRLIVVKGVGQASDVSLVHPLRPYMYWRRRKDLWAVYQG